MFLAVTKNSSNKALNDVIENAEKTEDANSPSLVNFCLFELHLFLLTTNLYKSDYYFVGLLKIGF